MASSRAPSPTAEGAAPGLVRVLVKVFCSSVLLLGLVSAAIACRLPASFAPVETGCWGWLVLAEPLFLILAPLVPMFSPSLSRRIRLWASLVLLGGCGLFLLLQRATDMGVFVLGGDRYWVRRAVQEVDPVDQRDALRGAINVVGYTLHTVPALVLEKHGDKHELRHRLFRQLAEVAPTEHWSELYLLCACSAAEEDCWFASSR